MSKTAWGEATIAEEITIAQGAFSTFVQLLEDEDGEPLVRFAYSTGGQARRGPVTLRRADLAKLKKALGKTPKLRAMLALTA